MDQTDIESKAAVTEAERWARGLDAIAGRISPRFPREEPRERATAYLRGLISPTERKNGWQLAEEAGDAGALRRAALIGVSRMVGRRGA